MLASTGAVVQLMLLASPLAVGYSYSGRLRYGGWQVGPVEQLRLVHVPNPQPDLTFYGNGSRLDPPSACTISWVCQLVPARPVTYESRPSRQGDNASAYYAQVQLRRDDSADWGASLPGYASVYVESRCGVPRLVSSVEILDCLPGLRGGRRFHYRARNAEMRGSSASELSAVNDWTGAIQARMPPTTGEGPVHVAMIADMTDIDYNTSIPGMERQARQGGIDGVVHAGDVAYDVDDDCGDRGDQFMRSIAGISSRVPYIFGPGDHEGGRKALINRNCGGDYEAMVARLTGAGGGGSPGQLGLSHGSGSGSLFYFSFQIGLIHFAVVNANAWVYACQHWMLRAMYSWLESDLRSVDRRRTPWVVLVSHRQAYCVKSNDTECNQEARSLRYGVPAEALARGMNIYDGWGNRALDGNEGNQYGLEELAHKYGVDIQFGGHTHHYERSWPVYRDRVQQRHYRNPTATVYVQGGLSGIDGDPFELPMGHFQAFRDESLSESWGRLSAMNASRLTWSQLFAVNGSVLDTFDIIKV